MKKPLIICGSIIASILIVVFLLLLFLPRLLPTRSSSRNLTVVRYGGLYPNSPIITLDHYVGDVYITSYSLEIKRGVFVQEPQVYRLPEIKEGFVVVNLEWRDEANSSFSLTYESADALYKKGLLIYQSNFDDYYMYFVSDGDVLCFSKPKDGGKWVINAVPPPLKVLARKENPGFIVGYSGWKENEWETTRVVS